MKIEINKSGSFYTKSKVFLVLLFGTLLPTDHVFDLKLKLRKTDKSVLDTSPQSLDHLGALYL